ncbi:hypothetical protein DOTSEDRAFT_31549 [Dothistroma septosporum NZE10]|uniref:Uncharacterized protein n=1 Tax=Dothistroma septosporum (strain NZE10 / CBS 128990) TaxID=675120 RepID=N1PXV1_DOTSN|nr:hypothetical protein DOTSEDRAFT_31549 [Dothistroma septosporum NZE10]
MQGRTWRSSELAKRRLLQASTSAQQTCASWYEICLVVQAALSLTRRADDGPEVVLGRQAVPVHADDCNLPIFKEHRIHTLACQVHIDLDHLLNTLVLTRHPQPTSTAGISSTTISVAPRKSFGGGIFIAYECGYHVPQCTLGPCPRIQTQNSAMAFAARSDVLTSRQIALRNLRLMQERVSQYISFPVTGSGVNAIVIRTRSLDSLEIKLIVDAQDVTINRTRCIMHPAVVQRLDLDEQQGQSENGSPRLGFQQEASSS